MWNSIKTKLIIRLAFAVIAMPSWSMAQEPASPTMDVVPAEAASMGRSADIPFWSPARINWQQRDVENREPSIRFPGPDKANYPNSPYTLPAGRSYIEILPLSFSGQTPDTTSNYNVEFLLRHGITDWLEFRIFSAGLNVSFARDDIPQQVGFVPITFDIKMHIFDEKKEWLLPAFGIEIALQTSWGSPHLQSGIQPSMYLLFDHSLAFDFLFEWNVGIVGSRDATGVDYQQVSYQFALSRDLVPGLNLFTQAYINDANLGVAGPFVRPTVPGTAIVVGGGFLWTVNDLVAIFASGGAGVSSSAPESVAQGGIAFAF